MSYVSALSWSYAGGRRAVRILPLAALWLTFPSAPLAARQQTAAPTPQNQTNTNAVLQRAVANYEQGEKDLDQYERIVRTETRRPGGDVPETKIWRVFPAGAAIYKIPLTADEKPLSPQSYRTDLEKLQKYLVWIAQTGSAQREAYAKAERKKKERFDLMEALLQALIFTPDGQESRDGRTLLRYSAKPNPSYKPTSRTTTILKHVHGSLWIDEQTAQVAKIDGIVTEDISLALFLAKVYKGSHFMQERYEVLPGLWEPTFEQYDFDGRRFFSSVAIHERTVYSGYKRVGLPPESIALVRAELSKLLAGVSAPERNLK